MTDASFVYQFREGYDYRKYLEQKSHFDRIELCVDKGIRNLIASGDILNKLQIESIEQSSAEQIAAINEQTSVIAEQTNTIGSFADIFEYGFEKLTISLDSIENSIENLGNYILV